MNRDTISGQWKQFKGSVKERWARLTDDDLLNAEGNIDKLVGSIQEHYGYSRERAESEVDRWIESLDDADIRARTR
jgi:uncharacterized protein YjbJ (UPF0337 family)